MERPPTLSNRARGDRPPSLAAHRFLDASLYTAPALLPLEMEQIFRRTWQYVGDATPLQAPQTVLVTEVAGVSLLITRTAQGELQAFHNVCPHRAMPFFPTSGVHCRKHLVCPYHGWVYTLEGQLQGTPVQHRFPADFALADFPLRPVQVEVWGGVLFVALDEAVPPLREVLRPIPTTMQEHWTTDTRYLGTSHYTVRCNWKNFHDNTLCDYHVAIAHRHTLSPLQGPIRRYEHEFADYVNLLYTPTTPDWRAANPVLEHLGDRNRYGFFTYGIFPNLHFSALPNGFMLWLRIDPLTVNTCRLVIDFFGIPGVTPTLEQIQAEVDASIQEDIYLTEGVQRGYESGIYSPGVANGLEARILHQQRLIQQFLTQAQH